MTTTSDTEKPPPCPWCHASGVNEIAGSGGSDTRWFMCPSCSRVFGIRVVPLACLKCGSARTRIVGQSGTPPPVRYRCEDCGHVSSRALAVMNDTMTQQDADDIEKALTEPF